MRRTSCFGLLMLVALGLAWNPLAAQESGSAAVNPWSGYWWPHKSGGLVGPLSKYDALLGTKAKEWEEVNHVAPAQASNDSDWWGYCHAWSAAAVSEKEPQQASKVKNVEFTPGDQKGLLCACHAQDAANFYGERYSGEAGEDPSDLSPEALLRYLQLYLGRDRIPLILDLDAGTQVWNYPVYQYRVDFESGTDGWANGTLQLLAAEDDVEPEYLGTRATLHTYTFRVKMEGGAIVEGTGQWTGDSVQDHPDFAWYPQVAQGENPEVDIAQVAKILGYAVGGENPPVDVTTPVDTPGAGEPGSGPPVNVPPPVVNTTPVPPSPSVQFANLLSPQELLDLVTNKTSHFKFDAFVVGGDGAKFNAGDPIKIGAVCAEQGYLYVFDIGPEGDLSLVFPLAGEHNLIEQGKRFDLPADGKASRLIARGHGQHDLKSIVLAKPLTLTGFAPPVQYQAQQQSNQKPGPGVQNPGQGKPPQTQVLRPQQLRVNDTTRGRVRRRLLGFFRKDLPSETNPPAKVPQFAQDSTSYFVFDNERKPAPNQGAPSPQP